jgi:peptide/nickel transport system ATP-binding protein
MTKVGARDAPTLLVSDLTVGLPPDGDRKFAVENASLAVMAGQTRCLVGESGSGKSVIGNAILGMLPDALPQLSGSVALHGENLPKQRDPAFNSIRSARIATIFQDASASLNPIKRIGKQLAEILQVHGFDASSHKDRIGTFWPLSGWMNQTGLCVHIHTRFQADRHSGWLLPVRCC